MSFDKPLHRSELGPIAVLAEKDRLTGGGIYLMTGAEEMTSASGTNYLRVSLEDASGKMIGFVWREHRQRVEPPPIPAAVAVSGRIRVFDRKPYLHIERLAAAAMEDVHSATRLLPRHRCPDNALPALDVLTGLESSLPSPLGTFLRRVLLDPAITLPLLRCRASVAHHHARPGGLLVHSTQMLDLAAELARRVLPDDPTAPSMAQIGLLLHDLGKLRTVSESRRPPGAFVIKHEFFSIELLAPHLGWLEQRNQALALGIRYIMAYLATPKRARPFAEYAVAEIVERLDELSAATRHQRDLTHLVGPAPRIRSVSAMSRRALRPC